MLGGRNRRLENTHTTCHRKLRSLLHYHAETQLHFQPNDKRNSSRYFEFFLCF
ncbi:unnamed protein product [Amoebophrya sp. A25]|nr:unnamed protein product [Amoebophrya sp. A25]|eukprot:GSA25T00025413001.1